MQFDYQPTLRGDLIELRPLRADDHDALLAVASDRLIWEQHPDQTRYNPEGFRVFFQQSLDSHGALVAIDRANGSIMGSSRYHGFDEAISEVEIGWTFLARKYWGGIYNREMKRLMLAHALRFVRQVIFVIGPKNLRSQRAVEKIGAVRDVSRIHRDSSGRESWVFVLPRGRATIVPFMRIGVLGPGLMGE
jgi:RimJ/RimL family protein N-acetyltransferase